MFEGRISEEELTMGLPKEVGQSQAAVSVASETDLLRLRWLKKSLEKLRCPAWPAEVVGIVMTAPRFR
jgi:hypothetical protein